MEVLESFFSCTVHYIRTGLLWAVILTILMQLQVFQVFYKWWEPWSDRWHFVFTICFLHEMMYYGLNGLFLLCDYKGIFTEYKISRKPAQVPTNDLVIKTLKGSTFSHWIIQPCSLYLLYPCFTFFGDVHHGLFPSFFVACWQIGISAFINDTLFYFTHRWLHSPLLYKSVHKQHHEYIGTIGFGTLCLFQFSLIVILIYIYIYIYYY